MGGTKQQENEDWGAGRREAVPGHSPNHSLEVKFTAVLSMGPATPAPLFGLGDDIMAMGPSLPGTKGRGGWRAGGTGPPASRSQGQETETTDTQLNHPVSWAAAPQGPAPCPSQP